MQKTEPDHAKPEHRLVGWVQLSSLIVKCMQSEFEFFFKFSKFLDA